MTESDSRRTRIGRASGYAWLRRAEQTVWGLSLAVMLGFLVYHVARQYALHGRLIDIDRAPPLDSRFAADINAADWPELSVLPGISETYARRIVAYRQKQGPFKSVEELTKVRGVGPKTLEKIRRYLYVSGEPPKEGRKAVAESLGRASSVRPGEEVPRF
jgi:competence protein ComEA